MVQPMLADKTVTGPLGEKMTARQLPPATTSRWVARRKAEVVAAIDGGLLSVAAACSRYNLTLEELGSWRRHYKDEGMKGLQQSSIQKHRPKPEV
ncbi:hypothetical protein HNO88_004245 [Novosphingobium chloroacetimidivorans]|uniref:DUF1153 domain-containing protein n=1 Tax=Novosphingobium chloroacetimidivorans TaxID=1428314 RepID=A0A7W7NYT9_9SPHN|nr:DUF1153 domain-containing protein [Novosphingobium chloroacetimidivorans]MBB4860899.1 hypothetical protein [Novosphingobium chloroacetimidivorans]